MGGMISPHGGRYGIMFKRELYQAKISTEKNPKGQRESGEHRGGDHCAGSKHAVSAHIFRHNIARAGGGGTLHDQNGGQVLSAQPQRNADWEENARQDHQLDKSDGQCRFDFFQCLCALKTGSDTDQRLGHGHIGHLSHSSLQHEGKTDFKPRCGHA